MLRRSTLPLALMVCLLWPAAGYGGHDSLSCGNCHAMHMGGDGSQANFEGLWSTQDMSDGLPTFTLYSSPSFDALTDTRSRTIARCRHESVAAP